MSSNIMLELIAGLFSANSFIPHGHCYLWKPSLVWLHILSDSAITIAYYSIPLTLLSFVQKRQDLPFDWIFLLFSAFIVSCGTTHLIEIWTLWHPIYWVSGALKAITALVSLYTAFMLVQLMPKALTLPSPKQLLTVNQALEQQIRDREEAEAQVRQLNQNLEMKVAQRTTELERSMVQVQEQAERVTLAMDAAKMVSWDWDLATQKIIWSSYHEVLFGYASNDLETSYASWAQRLHPDDLAATEAAIETAMSNKTDFSAEYRIIWDDGTERWLAAFGRFYFDPSGEPLRMAGMLQDISDRKQAELDLQNRTHELSQINRQLIETTALVNQRNQELDQFAHVVSHDLKAPLRAINNLSEWIEEDLNNQLPPATKTNLALLRSRVRRMDALINGLLSYARISHQTITHETFSLHELLLEIIDSLNIPAEFAIQLPTESPYLTTSRLLLNQVLTNLISNAVKHHHRPDGRLTITVQAQGAGYEFAISDDGPGIDPQYHSRIFKVFQTLASRDQKESTGIGLAIVKKIIEQTGGQIFLESKLGQGSTFRFTWLNSQNRRSPNCPPASLEADLNSLTDKS